jgi:isopenicillin N synthase-like dioxygenase
MPPAPALVPIVDLASPTAAADLAAAAASLGCAYLTHHGVPAATRDALFAATAAFFGQPAEVKAAIAADANFRGFTPLGDESLALADSAGDGPQPAGGPSPTCPPGQPAPPPPAAGDRKEGLYFGRDLPADHPLPLHGPNQWPAGLPGFRGAVEAAQASLEECSERLVPLLGAGLGGGEASTAFEAAFLTRPRQAMAFLRPLHYPPLPADAGAGGGPPTLGAGEHTDYGFLTLLLVAGGAPGLEIELPGGAWAPVPPGPAPEQPGQPGDTTWPLFFNCGDMLHRWSGGRYASARHRVAAPPPGAPARFSAAFFYDPPGDCVCAPVGEVDDATRARWPPVRYLEYLQGRFAATHASYEAATGGGGEGWVG